MNDELARRFSAEFDAVVVLSPAGEGAGAREIARLQAAWLARLAPVFLLARGDTGALLHAVPADAPPPFDPIEIAESTDDAVIDAVRTYLYMRGFIAPLVWSCGAAPFTSLPAALPRSYHVHCAHPAAGAGPAPIAADLVLTAGRTAAAPPPGAAENWLRIAGEDTTADAWLRAATSAAIDCRARAAAACRPAVAMLYDPGSVHVSTVREHLEAFRRYSKLDVVFVPASAKYWRGANLEAGFVPDLSVFDVAVVHYSIRTSVVGHLAANMETALVAFRGLKVLYIQDEYEGTEITRGLMDRVRFDLVYTCVPLDQVDVMYPAFRFAGTEFRETLTGYVPESPALQLAARPLAERKTLIAYRGRKLPAIYGELGYEKYRIGVEMKKIAAARGLPVDIEVDDAHRIYGTGWYDFLGSARATLGTESGANILDVGGFLKTDLQRLEAGQPGIAFEELFERLLAPHEGRIRMNQISPKIFEAICLRTALVLFEGSYSGALTPHRHYIPLNKDFSNIDDVLQALGDDRLLEEMTERAYRDVVLSEKYSYRTFVAGFDSDVRRRLSRTGHVERITATFRAAGKGGMTQLLPGLPSSLVDASAPGPVDFRGAAGVQAPPAASPPPPDFSRAVIKRRVRKFALRAAKRCVREVAAGTPLGKAVRYTWVHVPNGLRTWFRRFV